MAMPIAEGDHLYQYAIIDGSLDMHLDPGKLAAQTGHAFGDSFKNAEEICPETAQAYRDPSRGGSKVTLEAKNASHLIKAFSKARKLGIPCALIVDQHHVLPPHFTGKPIITAIGIGPCTKAQCREVTKKFQCVKRIVLNQNNNNHQE
ncbi:aminoacyl-tRNA hydrolase [Pseudomonas luteola]